MNAADGSTAEPDRNDCDHATCRADREWSTIYAWNQVQN